MQTAEYGIYKVGRGGMVTLPKTLRDETELREGDFIGFELRDEGILLKVLEVGAKSFKPA